MKNYTIQSYVPEEKFLLGKDARFCRAAFEDAFVIDLHAFPTVIASCKGSDKIELSMANTATLVTVFDGSEELLMLPASNGGTVLVYPAWRHLEMALAFLVKESPEEVEKTYQNAQRYAFSALLRADEANRTPTLEVKLCVLQFYLDRLFGKEREENVAAHILMFANLAGCHLHEVSVSQINFTHDERELERFSAYLLCAFMTMRRRNGVISTSFENNENTANLTHVAQEYGIRIQQSVRTRITKRDSFDLPTTSDFASFSNHPIFQNYQIEEDDGTFSLRIPLHPKVHLSSLSSRGIENELILTLFPLK